MSPARMPALCAGPRGNSKAQPGTGRACRDVDSLTVSSAARRLLSGELRRNESQRKGPTYGVSCSGHALKTATTK
jgi:hypothetical protein